MSNAQPRRQAGRLAILFMLFSYPGMTFLLAQQKDQQVFHSQYHLDSGKTVTIKGANGPIHASLSTDGNVHIEARKFGSAANGLKIAASERPDGVLICAIPAQQRDGASCATSTPEGTGVDFKVQIPEGVALVVHNGNGAITVSSLHSRVEATAMKGDIAISTTDTISSARTETGSLDLAMGKLWTGLLAVKTKDGDIRLKLPRNVAFQPSGKTDSVIKGSGPVQLKGIAVTQKFSQRGVPAPELEISTLHGKVTISTGD